MNGHRKGLRSKRKAKAWLRDQEYYVADVEDNSEYGSTDVFGVADVLAVKDGNVWLVQVKTNTPETQKVMQRVADQISLPTKCLTWYDREGLRVQTYRPNFDFTPWRDYRVDSSEVTRLL